MCWKGQILCFSLSILQNRIEQIDLAIIAESARWGDSKRRQPFTKADWQREVDRIVEDILPVRTEIVLQQLKDARLSNGLPAPLYPSTQGPRFHQHGTQRR